MRRADLRVYDIRLISSILEVFCGLSVIFFLFLFGNYIIPKQIPIKTYLWSSYIIIVIIIGIVYFFSKNPKFEWVRLVGASDMIGKGKYPLEKRKSYLVEESGIEKSNDILTDSLTYKVPCLYVTRNNPDVLRSKNKQLSDANIIWLTELQTNNAVNPTEVEEITYSIKGYLDKTGSSVILFDGLPYMLNSLSYTKVLHFLQDLRDQISVKDGVLLLTLDPEILAKEKLAMLEREMSVL